MFNGQFRLYENLMYEKKFATVNFAESLQWPIYNYLLCNKKIVGHYNYIEIVITLCVSALREMEKISDKGQNIIKHSSCPASVSVNNETGPSNKK